MDRGRDVHLCVGAQQLEVWMAGMRGAVSDALAGKVLCLCGKK
jgi:hypothetical protein